MSTYHWFGIMVGGAVVLAGLSAFVKGGVNASFGIRFLLKLKTFLVTALISSSVLMISVIIKSEIQEIGNAIDKIAIENYEEDGRHVNGVAVVSAVIGVFMGGVISVTIVILENVLGSIGPNKYVSPETGKVVGWMSTLLKSPFTFALNVIGLVFLALLIGLFTEVLFLSMSAAAGIRPSWEPTLIGCTLISAFLGALAPRGLAYQSQMVNRAKSASTSELSA